MTRKAMRLLLFSLLIWPLSTVHAQIFVPTEEGAALQAEASTTTGAGWADYDGDGDLDVAIGDVFSGTQLFRNEGEGLFELAAVFGDPFDAYGVSWGDMDNDGDLDLVINSLNAGSRILVNEAERGFVDQASSIGAVSGVRDLNLVDVDRDGLLDVFLVRRFGLKNRLFRNTGEFVFEAAAGAPGHLGNSVSAAWGDYDSDGDPDPYVTNTSSQRNMLYRNEPDRALPHVSLLIDDTYDVGGDQSSHSPNWVDFDGDGDLDLFVGNTIGSDDLYRNDGTGIGGANIFTPIEAGSLTEDESLTHSSVWGDVDNDGDLDVVVSNRVGLTRLHINDGSGFFESQGLGSFGYGFSATLPDYDNDGDLDLFVTKGEANSSEKNQLFSNTTDGSGHWLQVQCVGVLSNQSAVGARISLKSEIAGVGSWQVREVHTRSGRSGQSGFRQHFGLGNASVVDSIVVTWPSGIQQVLEDVAVNQMVTIVEEGEASTASGETAAEHTESLRIETIYPNPALGSTSIRVAVRRAGPMSAVVYDGLGRRVRTLLDRDVQAGVVDLVWDARSDRGDRLATGTYFVRVAGPERHDTAAITLVR